MICPFPASHPPSRVVASWGQGPLSGTFSGLSPAPNTEPARREADDQCYGVKNQTCHCTNENSAQNAVGRHLIGFYHLTPDTIPSQNSQQVAPCSGILQLPEPGPPLALSPSVTCSMVSTDSQARSKSRKWPMATSCPGSGLLRALLESRHCPLLSG